MKLSYESFILSASGWRTVFAVSGSEEDTSPEIGTEKKLLAALAGETFADFMQRETGKHNPVIVIGTDTRPTGPQIADAAARSLLAKGAAVRFLGVSAAPEIMAYSKSADGFMYISASHNPVGHNGIKFGLNDGGVLSAAQVAPLIAAFKAACEKAAAGEHAEKLLAAGGEKIQAVYDESAKWKKEALAAYAAFTREVVSGETDAVRQQAFFDGIRSSVAAKPVAVVCDMNGSARTLSIDRQFLREAGIGFYAINDEPGKIVHAIIPEPENLVHCASLMTELQKGDAAAFPGKHPEAVLGFMPDCDGDRGNIVYWDSKSAAAEILRAQEVFALSVLAETAYLHYCGKLTQVAVAVNDPTSMRIDDIAAAFDLFVARAEVGEANVVSRARELRAQGYTVRVLGEGSNGGNITHPAAVRDPLNTIFALLKLLTLRDSPVSGSVPAVKGLFHLWCEASQQMDKYRADFTLRDIIATLPPYATTGVSEARALAPVKAADHAALKAAYQKVFLREWETKKTALREKYGLVSWEAVSYNGTKETRNLGDFSLSGKGGLKIIFSDAQQKPAAFIWMRGSGTEPVFRILCDVKGNKAAEEAELLAWHADMLLEADSLVLK